MAVTFAVLLLIVSPHTRIDCPHSWTQHVRLYELANHHGASHTTKLSK